MFLVIHLMYRLINIIDNNTNQGGIWLQKPSCMPTLINKNSLFITQHVVRKEQPLRWEVLDD